MPLKKKIMVKKSPIKKVDEIYQKMEHKIHIYTKPDTYVGSCEAEPNNTYTFDQENNRITNKILLNK